MTGAALYARYSSDRQNPLSCADQLQLLQAHAQRRGWTVVATFQDAAISGAAMANRPGLQALIATAEAGGIDLVLVEDQDRLARNLEHEAHVFNRLKAAGVRIATLATDEVKILDVAFKGLMNELYLEALAEKTRRGVRANAERGKAIGGRTYGYRTRPGGDIEIDPDQAAVIVSVHRMFADEGLSTRQIADRLNREGIPSPFGGSWGASTIAGGRARRNGLLHADIYNGVRTYGRNIVTKDRSTGKRIHNHQPPEAWKRVDVPHLRIVPADLWARTQALLNDPKRSNAGQANIAGKSRTLFSGLWKCPCGASYVSYSKTRLVCTAHRERGSSVCTNAFRAPRQELERRVLQGLQERLLSPEAASVYVRAYHEAYARLQGQRQAERAPMQRRIGELERQVARLVDGIATGQLAVTAALGQRLKAAEDELAQLQTELAARDAASPSAPVISFHPSAGEAYARLVADLRATLESRTLDPDADAKVVDKVRDLVERIVIHPDPEAPNGCRLELRGNLAMLLDSQNKGGPGISAPGLYSRGGTSLVAGGSIGQGPPLEAIPIAC